MNVNRSIIGLFVLVMVLSSTSLFAQNFEVHPYAGGFFTGDWKNQFQMKNEGVYGLKAGVALTDRVQLGWNWGWMPHMEFKGTDPRARGMIWEVTPSINLNSSRFGKAKPFVTVGVGAVTGFIGDTPNTTDRGLGLQFRGENDSSVTAADILRNADTKNGAAAGQSLIMRDGDTFFAVSYGAGLKALRLWGPMGLRGEVRGRSMPNFYGNSMSWLETTGGLTFTWGER